jgi:hypothetical protein
MNLAAKKMFIVYCVVVQENAATPPNISRQGNRLVDLTSGSEVRLKGIAYMGGEYMCVKAHGIFDGPTNQSIVDAWKLWGINAVRIPMNEIRKLLERATKMRSKSSPPCYVQTAWLLC